MKQNALLLGIVALFAGANSAWAKLQVVTTLPSFANIAEAVGGGDVNVVSLTRGNQDPHYVDAKPDLILYLNKADLLIRAGLQLEDGWLPPLVTGSRNGKIQVGSEGYLDCSSVVELRDVPRGPIDRTMGDVHPGGNPHFMLDPRNGILVAKAIAKKLGSLDNAKAEAYEKRATAYSAELSQKIAGWEKLAKTLKGLPVITYHKSWGYFSNWVGMVEAGYVEPKPGIPPSPDHVAKLIQLMREKKVKWILAEPFYPTATADEVAAKVGATLVVIPTEVNGNDKVKTYFAIFDEIFKVLVKP